MKIEKIKTTYLMTAGKCILWFVVILLIFCGVKSILSESKESELENLISNYQSEASIREQTRVGAAAFAESFAYEYFTYNGQLDSDYVERVNRYLAGGLDIKNPNAGTTSAEVLSAQTLKVNFVTNDQPEQMDIDILTKVKYVSLTGETTGVISEQDICLRVPVIAKVQNVKGSKGGSFVIASLPMVVPLDEKADAKGFSGYSGAEISRTEKEELKPVLESFFKSYYEGTDSEISYYVSEGANIKSSLAGAFLFNRIEQLSISLDEAENVYLAEAKISILDHGQQIDQRIFLRLEKEKDKYYIKRMTTRPL